MSPFATIFDAASLATHASTHTPSVDGSVWAQEQVDTSNLRSWIQDNVFFVILVLAACVVGVGGMKGNFSKVVTVGGLSLVGVAFFAIATNQGAAASIGDWMLSLFGVSTGAAPAAAQ